MNFAKHNRGLIRTTPLLADSHVHKRQEKTTKHIGCLYRLRAGCASFLHDGIEPAYSESWSDDEFNDSLGLPVDRILAVVAIGL